MQEIAVTVAALRLAAGDDQHVLLRGDLEFVGLEAGDRERDPVAVVAKLLDIEGREVVLLGAVRIFEEVEQPVEADGRATIGG